MTSGLKLEPGSKISVTDRLRYRETENCEIGQILNPQVDAADEILAGTCRTYALDIADHPAQAILDDAFGAWFANQPLVIRQLQTLLATVVNIGKSEQVTGHFAGRIIAAIFTLQIDTRNSQVHNRGRLLRRHVTA
jgi:hypothetical protein